MADFPILGRNLSELSVSSREIAELVKSRHPDVMRSIDRLAEKSVIAKPPLAFFEEINNLGLAVKREHYLFIGEQGRRDSIVVVAQLSPEVTARLVDRWQELEESALAQFDIPKDYAGALRLAADAIEQKAVLEAKIAADQPKVEFAMAVRNMDDTVTVEEFAKTLGTGRNRFFRWLRDQGILQKSNIPYQRYLDYGWFKVVEDKPWVDKEGNLHPSFSTRITGKGQVGLESRYRNEVRNGLVLLQGGVA